MTDWIDVTEQLPPDLMFSYQLIVVCKKVCGPDTSYAGQPMRSIVQDWIVRRWPENFLYWMALPGLPNGDGQ